MSESTIRLAPGLFDQMPRDMAAVIRDEAQLRRSRETVEQELAASVLRLVQLRRVASWWSFLTRGGYRREWYRARNHEEHHHHQLTGMLRQIKGLQKRLSPSVTLRTALAQRLGESEPSYRQGLRASRFHEHWRRHHTLVKDRLAVFTKKLRRVESCLTEDVHVVRRHFSRDSQHAIEVAGAAAVELETHVAALNEVSKLHRGMVVDTPFSEVHLPQIKHWDPSVWLARLDKDAPAEGQAEAARRCQQCEQDWTATLGVVDVLFRDAASLHSSLAEHFMNDALEGMITHAERHWVQDRALRDVIDEVESRLVEAERARWAQEVAQKQDPQAL